MLNFGSFSCSRNSSYLPYFLFSVDYNLLNRLIAHIFFCSASSYGQAVNEAVAFSVKSLLK